MVILFTSLFPPCEPGVLPETFAESRHSLSPLSWSRRHASAMGSAQTEWFPAKAHDGTSWLVPLGDCLCIRVLLLLLLFLPWKHSDLPCLENKVQIPQQDICSLSEPGPPGSRARNKGLVCRSFAEASWGTGGKGGESATDKARSQKCTLLREPCGIAAKRS